MYPSRPSAAGYADATRVANLLAQRPPWSDRGRPEQLLLHVAPHVSDLLLHAAGQDLHAAGDKVTDRFAAATVLTSRAARTVHAATVALRLLRDATPRDDHVVALALRLSAPTASPGWRALRHGALSLDTALNVALAAVGTHLHRGLDPAQPLYRLVEAMAGLDLAARTWRDQSRGVANGLTASRPATNAPDSLTDPHVLFPSLANIAQKHERESA